jgi:chemotaxis regulatin CheY-phosphate phosphatase CheZ
VVAEEVEHGIQDEEKAIESLLTISNASVALSRDIEQVVETMNRDLDGVLESLQFQDITRQMVEGVQFMVSEVRNKIIKIAQPADGAPIAKPDQSRIKELRTRLIALAHTKGEKEAIQEVLV